jgi:hypothetical protein
MARILQVVSSFGDVALDSICVARAAAVDKREIEELEAEEVSKTVRGLLLTCGEKFAAQ